ncbi:VTT domain-containing protein [Aquipuribacter nitratireducens]|uniref:VTT domain-containing protein n=1 Tax=Aquipuribacter nitratireducens TaxID=650104 RepID=A0ABW0GRV7_9MICO
MSEAPARPRAGRGRAVALVALVVVVNVGAYALLATDTAQRWLTALEQYAYGGSFLLSLLTNATVAVPVPYNPVVLQIMTVVEWPFLVAVLAAAGSALGESTGWWVGAQGRAVLPSEGRSGRVVTWLHRQSERRVPAAGALAVLAAVPNPAFDVAGLVAGTAGLPYPLFLVATFVGRLVRFLVFVLAAPVLLDAWPF